MRKVNDFTLVNVRVSEALFNHIQEKSAFVSSGLLLGQATIMFAHNVEFIHHNLKHRYDQLANPAMERALYKLVLEISELYSVMKNGKYEFAHIMVDIEQPLYKTPFERMGISA